MIFTAHSKTTNDLSCSHTTYIFFQIGKVYLDISAYLPVFMSFGVSSTQAGSLEMASYHRTEGSYTLAYKNIGDACTITGCTDLPRECIGGWYLCMYVCLIKSMYM